VRYERRQQFRHASDTPVASLNLDARLLAPLDFNIKAKACIKEQTCDSEVSTDKGTSLPAESCTSHDVADPSDFSVETVGSTNTGPDVTHQAPCSLWTTRLELLHFRSLALQPSIGSPATPPELWTFAAAEVSGGVQGLLPAPSVGNFRVPGSSKPKALPRSEQFRRQVQSKLNKACPENVQVISQRLLEIGISEAAELQTMIELIFGKCVSEPHYCETYADMVYTLALSLPEFETPNGPVNVKTALLNICQKEFETLPTPTQLASAHGEVATVVRDQSDLEKRARSQKDRIVANMRLIGHLFLRRLLSAKVVVAVIQDLLSSADDEHPVDIAVECACELLVSVGFTLDSTDSGSLAVAQACTRLSELLRKRRPDGQPIFNMRIRCLMQDLLDIRAACWRKTVHRSSAKTMAAIRDEQDRLMPTTAREVVIVGKRPDYIP